MSVREVGPTKSAIESDSESGLSCPAEGQDNHQTFRSTMSMKRLPVDIWHPFERSFPKPQLMLWSATPVKVCEGRHPFALPTTRARGYRSWLWLSRVDRSDIHSSWRRPDRVRRAWLVRICLPSLLAREAVGLKLGTRRNRVRTRTVGAFGLEGRTGGSECRGG